MHKPIDCRVGQKFGIGSCRSSSSWIFFANNFSGVRHDVSVKRMLTFWKHEGGEST